MSRFFRKTICSVSKMKCRICGGWGGEWGDAQGDGSICHDCWVKLGYGK